MPRSRYSLPRVPEQVAAHDALEADRLRRLHQHRPARDVARGLGEVGRVARDRVVADDPEALGLLEPEPRERGEHAALVGDVVGQHDVEHRHAVGCHDQQPVVTDLVELAHLARVDVRQRGAGHVKSPIAVERVERAPDVGERALQVEAGVEARVVEHARHLGVAARAVRGTAGARPTPRIALRCTTRYASSRAMPASTSAEQHRLAEHEPVRRVEVLEHALRVDAHALDHTADTRRACSRRASASRGG